MPFGEVNHKINIAILKILLIKELFIFSFARLFEFTGGLYNSSKNHFADYRIEM